MITMDELLISKDVARILRININTARAMLQEGKIKGAFKIGRTWKIRQVDLERFIDKQQEDK